MKGDRYREVSLYDLAYGYFINSQLTSVSWEFGEMTTWVEIDEAR